MVSIHGKNGFGHNNHASFRAFAASPFQMAFQFAEMIVRENAHGSAAESCTIDQSSMRQFIEDNDIVLSRDSTEGPPRQRRNRC